jgi:hypothetical protein
VANAMLIATLCGSYKTEVAALSKLNLGRKILAVCIENLNSEVVVMESAEDGERF